MSFTAKKLDWIERVVRDHTVQPSACRVATLIGLYYLNRTSGDAWPSQSKLAADLGVSRSTMQRALNELAGSGHMTRQISCGKTNHYRPILEAANVQDDAPIAEPTCVTDDAPIAANEVQRPASPATQVEPLPASPVTPLPASYGEAHNPPKRNPLKERNPYKTGDIDFPANDLSEGRTASGFSQAENKTETPVLMAANKSQQAAIPLIEAAPILHSAASPSPQKQERRPMNISVEDYCSFEIWWEAYPKRVAKFAAATAYGNVLKLGLATTETLLAGAKRYAAERAGQEAKFTKHPTTWLNGGCWMDEPQAPAGLVKPGSAYAGLRSFVEDGDRGK